MSKVFGTRIKVKKIFENVSPLKPEGEYKNKVEVVDLGLDIKNEHLSIGQHLLLTENAGYDTEDFTYIVEQHILEIL
jgi:hypothetical protein